MRFKASGQSTGIGSFPFKDADQAIGTIVSLFDIPFWPQLPQRSALEGMIAQYSEKIPGVICRNGSVSFDPQKREEELEAFYERVIARDADYFAPTLEYARGLHRFVTLLREKRIPSPCVKGHVTGPFTFAGSVKGPDGKSLLGDPVMLEAVINALTLKAVWQIRQFRACEKEVVLFIDEPYLGCFGSAYTPLNEKQVQEVLQQFISAIRREEEALVGIHCCGNTDWGILLGLDIDIISFDAFGFLERFLLYDKQLRSFINRNKTIAWGIAPTFQKEEQEINPEQLIERFRHGVLDVLKQKGVDTQKVIEQSLFTPSCGLGNVDISRSNAEVSAILTLVREVSLYFRQ